MYATEPQGMYIKCLMEEKPAKKTQRLWHGRHWGSTWMLPAKALKDNEEDFRKEVIHSVNCQRS